MSIVQRRVFYAKVGRAEELVQHLLEGEKMLRQFGVNWKSRLLTDYMSGRSDRVASEWEVDNLQDIEDAMNRAMGDPQAQATMGPWLEKLNDLIHYSEAENWAVR
ncbi:MAG: hypothetical protein ACE5KI_00120 [Dehalococcoidia bacterium]